MFTDNRTLVSTFNHHVELIQLHKSLLHHCLICIIMNDIRYNPLKSWIGEMKEYDVRKMTYIMIGYDGVFLSFNPIEKILIDDKLNEAKVYIYMDDSQIENMLVENETEINLKWVNNAVYVSCMEINIKPFKNNYVH